MKIGKFISLIKDRPILYDSLHPLYKHRKEKERIWREISTAMKIHSEIAKNRWKSLKDCYTKHLKSTLASGPTVYLKYINWQWAEQMEFMKPHIKFGIIISNMELQDSQETDVGVQSSFDEQRHKSCSEVQITQEICEIPDRSGTPDKFEIHNILDTDEKTETQEISDTHKKPKKVETSIMNKGTKVKVRRRRRASITSPDDNTTSCNTVQYLDNKKIDDFSATELIFLGYAKTIKTFSVRRQVQVKMKIAKIMMEEEIANFEEALHGEYQ